MSDEVASVEYETGDDIRVRKIPGPKKVTGITLERGIAGDLAFC